MTDLKTYFASPEEVFSTTDTSGNSREALQPTGRTEDVGVYTGGNFTSPTTIPFIVKRPASNSKLILQNMEEVLNSVKKKHRQKHKRKKELKRLAQLKAEAASASGQNSVSTMIEKNKTAKHERKERKHHKKPLQEKLTQENGLSDKAKTKQDEIKSPQNSSESILKHFQRTPKKGNADICSKDRARKCGNTGKNVSKYFFKEGKYIKTKTNAFEVMMNARNKIIGSNTSGKEPEIPPTPTETTPPNVKRKLMLQEWATKKGVKRQLEEESRTAYVNRQLENRAKRFKKMLVNGSSLKYANKHTPEKATKEHATRLNSKKSIVREVSYPNGKARDCALLLSSSNSGEPVVHETVDLDTVQFLSKLSSPTKKRDSLLGYFPKKESPRELGSKKAKEDRHRPHDDLKSNELPKRRSNRSNVKNNPPDAKSIVIDTSIETITDSISTPSGRPKRSCAGKSRYDFDLQESPTKNAKDTSTRGVTKTSKSKKNDSIEVIALDDSNDIMNNMITLQTTTNLAPLFLRSVPKPTPDPELLKARHEFLMSSVPEKIKLEQAKQKQCEQCYEESLQIFPKIGHIRQWNMEQQQEVQAKKNVNNKIKLSEIWAFSLYPPATSGSSRKFIIPKTRLLSGITNCISKDFRTLHKTLLQQQEERPQNNEIQLPTLENKRAVVKLRKQEFENFPTYKCYNQMREKYRYFNAIDSAQDTEQVSESLVVTRRTRRSLEAATAAVQKHDEKPPAAAPNGELLFTEKYKPMLYEQVLVNLIPVTQFRDFLINWTNGNGNSSARNSQTLNDSMDIANDSNSNQQTSCNSVVLVGPSSSGKTNAVFALANELNFNVLEINAGMKRTGKKLIQELQEATQSHQIRKETPVSASSSSVGTRAQKDFLKMSLTGLKTMRQAKRKENAIDLSADDSTSSTTNAESATRKCLILIEDADIVFEQTDAGFTDAINTLAASSKRPVIIVAQQSNCAHLERLMLQNTIQFTQPNVMNISRFLAILSLIENCPIDLDDIRSLYLYNSKDLRKTLLEIQFFIQSGGDRRRDKIQEKHREPQGTQRKKSKKEKLYASPSKLRFSEESSACIKSQQDNKLANPTASDFVNVCDNVYTHRTLFEFYTREQNENFLIPYPVDIQLLHINLCDIFKNAQTLNTQAPNIGNDCNANSSTVSATKRKSRSPKKAWLNNMNSSNVKCTNNKSAKAPLAALCDFYENISIASNLCIRNADACGQDDRLIPHLSDDIAHNLVEGSIGVNLAAKPCSYNLLGKTEVKHSLADYLDLPIQHTPRVNALDYEPALRSICRSEKYRSTLERRSTRFYHYLRNYSMNMCNFSLEPFDKACDILQNVTALSSNATASPAT